MKKEYIVYFEVYNKKLKTKVEAKDENQAMEIVKSSINIVKVEKGSPYVKPKSFGEQDILDDFNDAFDEIINLFKKKK